MRERTTWDRDRIASLAAKLAEDPRAMNQDHLQQQPSATEYETGGPSEFAEDVHESGDTWKAEYEGDETRRNEIGMPEFRSDTFKAAEDHGFLIKKADLCVDVARALLGKTASDDVLVDQALSFMTLSDSELLKTASRLVSAADEDEDDEEEAEADEEQAEADEEKAQAQQEKAQAQQDKQATEQQEEKKEAEQGDKAEQEKQAADQQEEKKETEQQEEKQAADQQEKKDEEDEDVQKKVVQAMCQMSQEQQQQLLAQLQQQLMSQQQPVQEEVQVQQQVPVDDEQLLSQMLDPQLAQEPQMDQSQEQMLMANEGEFEIELESPEMSLDVTAGQEDEVLRSLFATDLEAPAKETPVRTASTRTVGTRPSGGVSKLGGSSPSDVNSDVDKLSNLWSTSPDVSQTFGR
jgi:hypothetical protein